LLGTAGLHLCSKRNSHAPRRGALNKAERRPKPSDTKRCMGRKVGNTRLRMKRRRMPYVAKITKARGKPPSGRGLNSRRPHEGDGSGACGRAGATFGMAGWPRGTAGRFRLFCNLANVWGDRGARGLQGTGLGPAAEYSPIGRCCAERAASSACGGRCRAACASWHQKP